LGSSARMSNSTSMTPATSPLWLRRASRSHGRALNHGRQTHRCSGHDVGVDRIRQGQAKETGNPVPRKQLTSGCHCTEKGVTLVSRHRHERRETLWMAQAGLPYTILTRTDHRQVHALETDGMRALDLFRASEK
jgi:hypothetical protein